MYIMLLYNDFSILKYIFCQIFNHSEYYVKPCEYGRFILP